jgi:hypothetical protein
MTDFEHDAVAVLNRRRKAEQIADWCSENGYDPAVIVDPAQRRWIVRQAIPPKLSPDGKRKTYASASDETWADTVTVFDDRRNAAALAHTGPGAPRPA